METIKLILPTKEYEKQVLDYKKEFESNGDRMHGTAGLKKYNSYEEWYSTNIENSNEETVRNGLVPSTTYLAVTIDDNKLVGMINIRHRLNDEFLQFGGHIGYSVRRLERRKGYGKEMLSLALKKCRERNIMKVLITCDKDNIASAKTIISNGGILDNEVLRGEKVLQRYWIRSY